MNENRVLLQPAYVLHHRPYRDTSALVELFTPEHGRLGVVARGVRGAKSKWRGLLQVFQPLLVSWSQRGELGTLTTVEAQGPGLHMQAEMIASGFYLNEILMRLLSRHDSHEELFKEYDAALRALAGIDITDSNADAMLENLLRKFEVRLLAELGYGLVLDHDVESGSPLQPDQQYRYFLERGPVAVKGMTSDDHAVDHNSRLVSGRTLVALNSGDLSSKISRQDAKRLLRGILGHYLGPKPLLSRELMRSANLAGPITSTETGAIEHNASR